MPIVSTDEIISCIIDGFVDNSLSGISAAIKQRREALNSKKIFSLARKDIVEFNSQVRPRYLVGLRAEVVRTNQKTVTVKVLEEDKFGARRFGRGEFRTPISLVDKVEV